MRKTTCTVALCALVLLLFSNHLAAQDLTKVFVEARLGILHVPRGVFLDVGEGNHFSFGGLFSYRPVVEVDSPWSRFTGRLSLDGAQIGGEDVEQGFRSRERLYLLNFAAGLDLVQSGRGSLTVHGGAAVSRNRFILQGFSQFGGTLGTGGFVDACNLGQDVCSSIWNLLGNYGVAGRFSPIESWPYFFVGADFTRYAGAKNQFVFTTGLAF
ncbi:MAG: hypothetical protein ACRD88_08260 [Terriglobia bacterium]